jgi:hypothetical protein
LRLDAFIFDARLADATFAVASTVTIQACCEKIVIEGVSCRPRGRQNDAIPELPDVAAATSTTSSPRCGPSHP